MAAGCDGRRKERPGRKNLKINFTPEQIAALREKIISRLEWHRAGLV
ncbi:putative terminase, ATPase subunit domain protein [Escherichia coli P0304777.1]|nr:putative terminase, ATPase subunit domain protein [Escherichia coli P0304777.1]